MSNQKIKSKPFRIGLHLYAGLIIRIFMIMYGVYHDTLSNVKYTDVDYRVMTDGALEVYNKKSPFNRHTYRYTPFLSYILIPNITVNDAFGKLLFSFLDVLVSHMLYSLVSLEGYPTKNAIIAAFMWLYNPHVIAMSTRGSSEVIPASLIVSFLYFFRFRLALISGFFLGLAIHFKLYPIIYILPVYLAFTKGAKTSLLARFYPSYLKLKFLVSVLLSFSLFTGFSYLLYGNNYIQEALIYHLSRKDTRHNFSLYFYSLYLCEECDFWFIAILTTLPQIIIVAAFGLKYGSINDLNFALLMQTVAFVTYNKVITSQYFSWFLVLLPLVAPKLDFSLKKSISLFFIWAAAQASWLLPAYLLEFRGINTFLPIWIESIAFFSCNIGIIISLVSNYNKLSDPILRKVR